MKDRMTIGNISIDRWETPANIDVTDLVNVVTGEQRTVKHRQSNGAVWMDCINAAGREWTNHYDTEADAINSALRALAK